MTKRSATVAAAKPVAKASAVPEAAPAAAPARTIGEEQIRLRAYQKWEAAPKTRHR